MDRDIEELVDRIYTTGKDRWGNSTKSPRERFEERIIKTNYHWLWDGAHSDSGYGQIWVSPKLVYTHVFSYLIYHGSIPDGFEVEHKCRNRGCINPKHLRLATRAQNCQNHSGSNKNSKTRVRGVWWDKSRSKYHAQVTCNGVTHFVGRFNTLEEAEIAVIAKRNILFEFNDLDRR